MVAVPCCLSQHGVRIKGYGEVWWALVSGGGGGLGQCRHNFVALDSINGKNELSISEICQCTMGCGGSEIG